MMLPLRHVVDVLNDAVQRLVEKYVLPRFPALALHLRMAKLPISPKEFAKKAVVSAFSLAFSLSLIAFLVLYASHGPFWVAIPLFPILFIPAFYYFMLYPHAKIIRRRWEIDREVVFAARHILISLKAGMPIYDALLSAAEGYGEVSKEFEEIIRRTTAGMPLNHAIRTVAEETPSENLRRILLQISNALTSGADVASALEAITEQIASEQLTALKAYGQKLNPLIMFYMMFAIIFPSIGIAFAIILFSLISGGAANFGKMALVGVTVFVAVIQYVFVNAVENSRPKYSV